MQFNAKLANKKNKIKDKCDFLLASDANMAWAWIVGGGDNNKKVLQDLVWITMKVNLLDYPVLVLK